MQKAAKLGVVLGSPSQGITSSKSQHSLPVCQLNPFPVKLILPDYQRCKTELKFLSHNHLVLILVWLFSVKTNCANLVKG